MQVNSKTNSRSSPAQWIGVLPRSLIESAPGPIRGPAIAAMQSNGIRNPREDIAVTGYHGSSQPIRGDTKSARVNKVVLCRGSTMLFRHARGDLARHWKVHGLRYPEVYHGSSPPIRYDSFRWFKNDQDDHRSGSHKYCGCLHCSTCTDPGTLSDEGDMTFERGKQ